MLPKDKAEQIIEKFRHILKWHTYDLAPIEELSKFDKIKLIKCSLVLVEELIEESRNENNVERFKYFREVKKEIETHLAGLSDELFNVVNQELKKYL